jgi:hypothetical protein
MRGDGSGSEPTHRNLALHCLDGATSQCSEWRQRYPVQLDDIQRSGGCCDELCRDCGHFEFETHAYVPPGIYFCRASSARKEEMKKITVIR